MEQNSEETSAAAGAETTAAPRKRASRRVSAPAGEAVVETTAVEAPAAEAPAAAQAAPKTAAKGGARRGIKAAAAAEASADAAPSEAAADEAPKKRNTRSRAKKPADAATDAPAAEAADAPAAEAASQDASADAASGDGEAAAPQKRNTRSRSRKPAADAASDSSDAEAPADAPAESGSSESRRGQNGNGSGNGQNGNGQNGNQRGGDQTRSSRTRQRERKRRQGDDLEPEIAEDDVLLPVAGILDVLDNYAFVRTSGYLPGTNDVYVSLGQVKKYGLRKGDAVVGSIRQPREGEGGGRQKYSAIVKIDAVNSRPSDDTQTRPEFQDLVPLSPEERLRLEGAPDRIARRAIDLFAPIGKGQRGIVSGPARSGKSTLLEQIAEAVGENHPEAHLMVVLVDERPEEVTRLQRSVNGEVIASTFDRPIEDHTTVAELSIERAKRLTELGHDVVVLIDSLSSLVRAYNLLVPAATRQPAGLVDAAAMVPVKRLLGAARNVENGGSLTIIAAVQSGTPVDDVILDELLGTANLELQLSRPLAERRLFPAIELAASSTRGAELFVGEAESRAVDGLRGPLAQRDAGESLAAVLQQLRDTGSNVEFLALAQRAQAR